MNTHFSMAGLAIGRIVAVAVPDAPEASILAALPAGEAMIREEIGHWRAVAAVGRQMPDPSPAEREQSVSVLEVAEKAFAATLPPLSRAAGECKGEASKARLAALHDDVVTLCECLRDFRWEVLVRIQPEEEAVVATTTTVEEVEALFASWKQ